MLITPEELEARRAKYPVGTKVRLIRFAVEDKPEATDDNLTIPPGTLGEVSALGVDDGGTVHTRWENGRNLGFLPEDEVEVIG